MTRLLKYALPNFFLLIFILPVTTHAALRTKFETTRMKSTGGTGIGSILLEESNFLNPAPLGLYEIGSIYLQRVGNNQDRQTITGSSTVSEASTLGAIITDAKGRVGGSASYFKTEGPGYETNSITASFGYPIGKSSAFGTSYRFIKSKYNNIETRDSQQITVGVTHMINNSISLGFVAIDPLKKVHGETRGIFGVQYVYKSYISIMFDMGADYTEDLSKSALLRGAIQFSFMNDFYLRAGMFSDKGDQEKGSGVGLSWVQPKLMLEMAMKNTTSRLDQSDKDQETSFSLSYRF